MSHRFVFALVQVRQKTQTRTIELDLEVRKGAQGKTFAATISTETPVNRGDYVEILSHATGAVDLSRAPLPLIESHDSRKLPIGVVDDLRISGAKLRGTVRFGTSARAQEVAADVEAGIIRNLSVGYAIERTEAQDDGETVTITATRWTPHEVSAVAIGADAAAGFGRNHPMSDNNETTSNRGDAALERRRCADIVRMARSLGLSDELAEDHIERGTDLDGFRAVVIDAMAERSERQAPAVGGPNDEVVFGAEPRFGRVESVRRSDDFRAAATDALLARGGVAVTSPPPAAGDINPSFHELARVCLSRAGKTVPRGGGTKGLVKRAMTTSDFPLILADVLNKSVRSGYEVEPASHRRWVHQTSVPDFRDQRRPILGSAPALEQVLEHGEYREGPLSEESDSYRVAKYGKIVSLTWETMVNDDVGAFVRLRPAMGQAARRLEADLVYNLFTENSGLGPTMSDGLALFHANHDNVVAGSTPNATVLGEARVLLRQRQALGGGYLSLVPRFIITPAEHETTFENILAAATRHTVSASTTAGSDTTGNETEAMTPEWISRLGLVVEPRLADDAFYIAAAWDQIDHVEMGLLDENVGGPVVEEDVSFGTDVYRWKIRHVVGVKALDHRGIVKVTLA